MEKYLVASSGDKLDSKVSGRFGHSGYFLIVDPGTMEYEVLPGVSSNEVISVTDILDSNITKVLIGNIGPSLYNEITAYGCKIYLCRNMPVPEAIKKVRNNEIPELMEPTLKESIHSSRKTGYNYGGHGKASGIGTGTGSGTGDGRGMGRGRGQGSGRGGGQGMGRGGGQGMGRGGGRGMGRGSGRGMGRG